MDVEKLRGHANDGLPFRVSLEAVNKGVGLVALGLPLALLLVTAFGFTCKGINSLSHYYYSPLGGDIFVGSLCFIGVMLLFFYKIPAPTDHYLGHRPFDIYAAWFAGACAFGVALFPTIGSGCESYSGSAARLFLGGAQGDIALNLHELLAAIKADDAVKISELSEIAKDTKPGFNLWGSIGLSSKFLDKLHYISAAGMFSVLAYYSLVVFPRPQSVQSLKAGGENQASKARRNRIYRLCGALILISMAAIGIKNMAFSKTSAALVTWDTNNLTFWFESLGLMAFGVSWGMKGRVFSIFRDPEEQDPKTGMTRSQGRAA